MKRRVLLFCLCFFAAPACFAATSQSRIDAVKSAAARDYPAAFAKARETKDPTLIKLIDWFSLTDANQTIDFNAAQRFMKKNPNWPRVYMIRRNAEQALLEKGDEAALEKWFCRHPPVSARAVLAYADILMRRKEWEKAVPMLHSLWNKSDLSDEEADLVRERLFFLLDERDFDLRARKLLNERKHAKARALFPKMNSRDRALAQVRADFVANRKNAQREFKNLPESQQLDADASFDLLRWLRVNKKYSAAAKLLHDIDPDKQNRSVWWTERTNLIRQFLSEKDYKTAYQIAKNHNLTKGADFADAEWTAGWIALRRLKKNDDALRHFKTMLAAVSSPMSVARAGYWLGRTYEAIGKKSKADENYQKAARHITTIYGQLAAIKLGTTVAALPAEHPVDAALSKKIRQSELYAVMKILQDAQMHDLVGVFATRLFLDATTPAAVSALAHLLNEDLKREDLAVAVARRARQNGIDIVSLGYPVKDLRHDERTETALVLSIIRQESSFASHAVSPAGARGLMQIMPATAKQMAKKKRKGFSVQKLNADPDFNVELGSAYIGDLLKRYGGSYILAIAAYNAGPTNVNRWLKAFGRPHEDVDPVDWIESIPFAETRNYVQRVLENLHIYRRHLNAPESELTVWRRGKDG